MTPTPPDAVPTDRIRILEQAVANCFMMARRQIAAHLNGTSTAQRDLERWQHVQRFCETTGSKSDILRGQLPTEMTEGSDSPAADAAPLRQSRVVTNARKWLERQRVVDGSQQVLDDGDCRYCGSASGEGHEPTDPCGIVAGLLEELADAAPLRTLRDLVTTWRTTGNTEYASWRSGADEKYRWRSSTLAQCADELDALLPKETP